MNRDVLYNILLQLDSLGIGNLRLLNKDTIRICESKQFWIEKFKLENIPMVNELNFEEYQRYEKCESIVKNIMILMKKSTMELGIMTFNNENILQYLPTALINEIKTDIKEQEILEDVPTEILKILNMDNGSDSDYSQTIYFSLYYDADDIILKPSISYDLVVGGDVLTESESFFEIKYLEQILTNMLYIFPSKDFHDSSNATYLPTICEIGKKIPKYRESLQQRYKFWKSKQWFI